MADVDCTASGRKCTKCEVFKPWSEFTKAARGRNGRDSRCKGCARAYYESNRLKINARQLARYHKLQEPRRAAKRELDQEAIASPVKRCCRCKAVKPKVAFNKDRNRKDGLKPRCRDCRVKNVDDPAIQRAWGLPNLRPLWGRENVRKNAKRTHLI